MSEKIKGFLEAWKQMPELNKKKIKSILFSGGLIFASLLVVTIGVVLAIKTVTQGAASAAQAYQEELKDSKEKARKEKYDYAYKMSYDIVESANHVKNRTALQLGGIQENADLEVLEVSGSEIVIEKAKDNKEKNEAWLEVIASGVYTVDLTCAEFIFDSENQHVWARVPKPVLDRDHFSTIYDNKLLFKNEKLINDGSIPEGEKLRVELIKEGSDKIYESLISNQEYYESAEDSAKLLIENLIKELNPEYDNLSVEIQFTK